MTGFKSKKAAALDKLDDDDTQVYQRPWIDLTDDQIIALFDSHNVYGTKWLEFARAVEAKLREKNTWPVSFSQLTLQNFTLTKGKPLFH